MTSWESESDREMAERMASESQRPAPTDGWRPFACAPEGGLREATPDEVRALGRTMGGEEVAVAFCCGALCGAAFVALYALALT